MYCSHTQETAIRKYYITTRAQKYMINASNGTEYCANCNTKEKGSKYSKVNSRADRIMEYTNGTRVL